MMKQTGKLTILMVAVVAIGIFALPSIMSVGAGQHAFVNKTSLEGTDPAKSCLKCHGTSSDDVKGELNMSDNNVFYNGANKKIHSSIQCADCHDETRAVGSDISGSHTKVPKQPECRQCHNGASIQTNNGSIQLQNVWDELSNATDAHQGFRDLTRANAGCIGCHTRVTVTGEVSYTYSASAWQPVLGLYIGNATEGKPFNTP